eukprot:CAMPEP_0115203982 /NCGR_PEP_ID=MMETSP0270-20121206/18925_1 /TAXON_ID=71861 /ORGANISM="Scrippsiella trochoidea, Strain CCMP3099" /LENGTH=72 /DNA_ID=CAMNT_0002617449 /DNA_START=210 /DNA_END=428 /DNA_ORIENTATION=-
MAALGERILEGCGEHIALLVVEGVATHHALLHEASHLVVALCMLRDSGKGDRLLLPHLCKARAMVQGWVAAT